MNGIAQVGLPILREVNYPPGLYVGMTVLDPAGAQIGALIPMNNVTDSVTTFKDTLYLASYTPPTVGNIVLRCAVYTDNTYTALDPDEGRSSEAHQVVDLSKLIASGLPAPDSFMSGYLQEPETIIGFMDDEEEDLTAKIEEC